MSNLAPEIFRQRLLLESYYSVEVTAESVRGFLLGLADHLKLRTYGEPIVHSPSGEGKEANQGFDAFVPLIDSGISLYVWSQARFFSAVIYSCKPFDDSQAAAYVSNHFAITGEMEIISF
jgi:S-adenosylmethionine decarboxylase